MVGMCLSRTRGHPPKSGTVGAIKCGIVARNGALGAVKMSFVTESKKNTHSLNTAERCGTDYKRAPLSE